MDQKWIICDHWYIISDTHEEALWGFCSINEMIKWLRMDVDCIFCWLMDSFSTDIFRMSLSFFIVSSETAIAQESRHCLVAEVFLSLSLPLCWHSQLSGSVVHCWPHWAFRGCRRRSTSYPECIVVFDYFLRAVSDGTFSDVVVSFRSGVRHFTQEVESVSLHLATLMCDAAAWSAKGSGALLSDGSKSLGNLFLHTSLTSDLGGAVSNHFCNFVTLTILLFTPTSLRDWSAVQRWARSPGLSFSLRGFPCLSNSKRGRLYITYHWKFWQNHK